MKRGLAWACGGLLVIGVAIRLSTGSKAPVVPTAPPRTSEQPVTPMPAAPVPQAAHVDPLDRRLPPPVFNAPESAWSGYKQALVDIRNGTDPRLAALATDRIKRLEDRAEFNKYLEERHTAALEEHRRKLEEQRAFMEARQRELRERLIQAGHNPDGPPPPPLFKRPDLGPPLGGEEPKKP